MAAKVCIGCGLKTDTSGNLVVSMSGVPGDNSRYPTTSTCKPSGGTHVYCDPTDGKIYGEPEKFSSMRRVGKNLSPNMLIDPGIIVTGTGTGQQNVGTPLVVTLENPSDCRPINLLIEAGVSHILFQHGGSGENGAGDYHIMAGTDLTITGSVNVATQGMGHQIWQHKGDAASEGAIFDSMGARSYANPIIVPAGGSVTLSLQGFLRIFSEQGDCYMQNFTIDLVYQAWTD